MREDYKTDKKLELWGEVFNQCALPANLTFAQFIESPWEHLKQAGQEDAPSSICKGYSPLLPAQVGAKRRLDAYWRANGFDEIKPDSVSEMERHLSNTDDEKDYEMDSLCPTLN